MSGSLRHVAGAGLPSACTSTGRPANGMRDHAQRSFVEPSGDQRFTRPTVTARSRLPEEALGSSSDVLSEDGVDSLVGDLFFVVEGTDVG